MNIHLQICGLVLSLFLLILYKTHSTIGLKGERTFVKMLCLVIVCLSLDALSVIGIHYKDVLPITLVYIICKAYLISMIWVGWIDFCYVMLDINTSEEKYSLMMKRMTVVTIIESIIVAILPIMVHKGVDGIYSEGLAVTGTYVFVLSYILFTLSVSLFLISQRNSRRGLAVLMTTLCWIIAAIIQMLNNAFLVVGFSMAVGIMILYVVMENPDSNLDRQFGCFNSNALYSFLGKKMLIGKEFHILDLSVTDLKSLEDRGVDVAGAARNIAYSIESIKDVMIFKGFHTGFVIISDNENKLEEVLSRILTKTADYKEAQDSITMFIVRHVEQFDSADDILKFLTYVRSSNELRFSAIVHVSDKLIEDYKSTQRIEKEIDAALNEDRVEVFFQPIWHHADNTVVSAEALVRIRNCDGSLMPPGMFIPIAESTGQVGALGERVLDKVCKFIKNTDVLKYGIQKIHVNLSTVQCDDSSMAGRLSQIVDSNGVNPKYISFEITETAVSQVKDVLIENMNALISKGFSFALDDFGKGESNLMYIVDMPVDQLKLDMDMSKAYFSNPKAKPVVMAVTDMAQQLDLSIVAEGIESREEVERITQENINLIQGYYYSKPLPESEFISYLSKNVTMLTDTDNTDSEVKSDVSDNETCNEKYKGKTILLVEDNEMNREIAQDILEDYGFNVDTAEDGTIAVEKFCNSPHGQYTTILMDIRMPMMDGYEATRRIRAFESSQSYTNNVLIIALTAQDTEEDRRLTFEAGMNEYMLKPLDISKLNKILEQYI